MSPKVKAIHKGSQIIDQIFWELLKLLKTGQFTERQLATHIRRLAKNLGASGMAFPPIVSYGPSSAEIHHKPGDKKIDRNNFLMLDYGVKVSGYCSDFTRTLFIGSPSKYQEKTYNLVLKAELASLKKVKIGAACAEIDLVGRNIIAAAGLARHYNHLAGHGVGRLIHELPSFSPTSPALLEAGTVMTVEPGIYLPGKFGIRIEDMILVAATPKVFSKVPKDFRHMIV